MKVDSEKIVNYFCVIIILIIFIGYYTVGFTFGDSFVSKASIIHVKHTKALYGRFYFQPERYILSVKIDSSNYVEHIYLDRSEFGKRVTGNKIMVKCYRNAFNKNYFLLQ